MTSLYGEVMSQLCATTYGTDAIYNFGLISSTIQELWMILNGDTIESQSCDSVYFKQLVISLVSFLGTAKNLSSILGSKSPESFAHFFRTVVLLENAFSSFDDSHEVSAENFPLIFSSAFDC